MRRRAGGTPLTSRFWKRASGLVVPVLLVLCTACSREGGNDVESADAEDGRLEGISRQEVREQARPMSPEQAESLGIVDTTTHLEVPPAEDSLIPPAEDTLQPPGSQP